MTASISHKCLSVTFSGRITGRKNYANLIIQIQSFLMENDTWHQKFILYYADDTSSIKMCKQKLNI